MATNWSHEKCEGSTEVEREAEGYMRVHSDALVPRPTLQIDHVLTNRVEGESPSAVGNTPSKPWFIGWDVVLAVAAGLVIFFVLDVASLGVLSSAVTVGGIVAAFGLGHYLLWGRVFARGAARESQRVQAHLRRFEASETAPPDEFVLGLNDRQRTELLQLIEHSLPTATGGREGSEDGTAIRRELQDRIRMFGA